MPFAGFKDFDDCVQKQTSKGMNTTSAHKYCGAIKAKVENELELARIESNMQEVEKTMLQRILDPSVPAAECEMLLTTLMQKWSKEKPSYVDIDAFRSVVDLYRELNWNMERKKQNEPMLLEKSEKSHKKCEDSGECIDDDCEFCSVCDDTVLEKMTYKTRKNLPDSTFALVYKDKNNNTVRKFPLPDCAHVRNALSRLPQANITPAQRSIVMSKIKSRNKSLGCGIEISK